ncbi:MAG: sulfite exporter TauE/SafE family protein [Alphaproteobacteria bacterium]|nr:sulfite exporter TauE/SafE family protein [Alphaproteobacteria bacterium]
MLDWTILAAAAFLAGVVDAVVGGGGMVQLPALFTTLPEASPAALFGTNKLASAVGTSGAAWRYARNISMPWHIAVPTILVSFVASVAGAYAITLLPADPLRKALPFLLFALLLYTLRNKDMGTVHTPRASRREEVLVATAGSAVIGFYDGFFGAGTGAFYKILFVRGLGYDFLRAAAPAKITNVASNIGAVVLFGSKGVILWGLGLWMVVFNFAGGQLGSRIAIRRGSHFIRKVFIAVVAVLIAKTFYDAYLR